MRDGQESTAGWGVGRSPNVKRAICVGPVILEEIVPTLVLLPSVTYYQTGQCARGGG